MCHQHRYQHRGYRKKPAVPVLKELLTKHSSKLNTHEQKKKQAEGIWSDKDPGVLFMPAVASSFTSSQIPS